MIAALLTSLLAAAAPSASAPAPAGNVDYAADALRIEPVRHTLLLDDHVHLSRGDLKVDGDHAELEYVQEKAAKTSKRRAKGAPAAAPELGGQRVRRFSVDGHVHVERGTRSADGQHAEMDGAAQTLVLTGTREAPPVVRDANETLTGDRVLMHLDSEDVDVARPHLVLRRELEAAAAGAAPTSSSAAPVRIDASHLSVQRARRVARFTDDVVVKRGDATVRSPRMDARYDAQGQLTRLELRGGVDLTQGDRRATGENADYDAATRQVVLTGDPRLYDRGDVLAGDRIGLSLDSREVRVDRARGKLHPDAHRGEPGVRP